MMKNTKTLINTIAILVSTIILVQPSFAAVEMVVTSTNGLDGAPIVNGDITTVKTQAVQGITAEVNMSKFNIPAGSTLNNYFSASGQSLLYTVAPKDGRGSLINGTIQVDPTSPYTGNVMISNSNGLLFGNGALIDTNSFFATTLKINSITRDASGYATDINFVERPAYGGTKVLGLDINGATIKTKENLTIVGPVIRVKDSTINAGGDAKIFSVKSMDYKINTNAVTNLTQSTKLTQSVYFLQPNGIDYRPATVGLNDRVKIENTTINANKNIGIWAYSNLATSSVVTIDNSKLTANAALASSNGEIYIYAENGTTPASTAVNITNNSEVVANRQGSGESVIITAGTVDKTTAAEVKTNNIITPPPAPVVTPPKNEVEKTSLAASNTNTNLPQNTSVVAGGNLVPFGAAAKMNKKKNRFVCEEDPKNKERFKNCEILGAPQD